MKPGWPSTPRTFVRRPPTRAQVIRRVAADRGNRIANPPIAPGGTQVSRTFLLADLANAAERNARLTGQLSELENALSAISGSRFRA